MTIDFEQLSWLTSRGAGVLMHISCLPSTQGIGCFDENCLNFIDFLSSSGMKYWQICPLHPTAYGDSPYQSTSAFAGNQYFIDLSQLINDGLLTTEEANQQSILSETKVEFDKLFSINNKLLQRAAQRFDYSNANFLNFCSSEKYWLDDYALFTSIKQHFNYSQWTEWPNNFKYYFRLKSKLNSLPEEIVNNIKTQKFIQYIFSTQWEKICRYAKEKGIEIIGDLPIFVGLDSADVWSNNKVFKLNNNLMPTYVAGVPPDAFSSTGQLWGNPVFDWDYLEKTSFDWWHKRIKHASKIYDIVRLDHFRGFYDYWEIPANSQTAINGKWQLGPGKQFFQSIIEHHSKIKLIAEDLGILSEGAKQLLKSIKLPGMNVMHFAFDGDARNQYLPHMHEKNSVLYCGTHDNNTTRGWYENDINDAQRDYIRNYLRVPGNDIEWDLIRSGYQSSSNLFISTIQDILSLNSDARFNTPGKLNDNWAWRMTHNQFEYLKQSECDKYLHKIGKIYGRI